MKNEGGKGFLKGAAWIAVGGFVAKLIGAAYRIPLTNVIGGRGLGLYQMVYPVYCILLTVSATGIPASIAKLTAEQIAQGKSDRAVFFSALKLFLWIGIGGTALMALGSPFLTKVQGTREVLLGYFFLAPSVFLVSAISVFRGWFQGRNNMFPTAMSEICEQVIKVTFGLLFAYLYRGNVQKAVIFLLLSVSISELVTLLLMIFFYKRVPAHEKMQKDGGRFAMKSILRLSLPVTFYSMLLPLSGLLDSVLVPFLLSAYETESMTLYGLFTGGAVTIINLPVSICYGIAAASVPAVAKAESDSHRRKKIFFALGVTVAVALPSAVGLFALAAPAVKIIFRNLSETELNTLIKLVKILSLSALTLSCVQTLSACLTAQGQPQHAALSMLIAITVKTAVYALLLRSPKFSIFGVAYATNLCYLVAFSIDLLYNLYNKRKIKEQKV